MNEKSNKAITAPLGNNKGFTLIEMAIVLVIIGIIIGAVVKGGDLIENAKDKQVMGEINTIKAAYYTYYDKKGVIPTGIGSLTDTTVGVNAPTASKPRPALTYAFNNGSLRVSNGTGTGSLSATNMLDFDTKYDDGTISSGAIQSDAGATYMDIRLK
jgi:prepilin-type N-terminal cleavage/methylation domain-containing protein